MNHDADGDYIMAASSGPDAKNRWSFSDTSREYLKARIRDLQ